MTITTHTEYLALFPDPCDAIAHENTVLNVGREFLPPCAQAVLDGDEPTPDYWAWLAAQAEVSP